MIFDIAIAVGLLVLAALVMPRRPRADEASPDAAEFRRRLEALERVCGTGPR